MSDDFQGWYFKCQTEDRTLSVIPAIHRCGGTRSCSVQVITDDGNWNVPFPGDSLFLPKGLLAVIGENHFSEAGMRLCLRGEGLNAGGSVQFQNLTPLRYDIMGPFRYVPWMECRHSVFSMRHTVNGTLWVNGTEYRFRDGVGYLEGDRGRSFPCSYLWTQCSFEEGALMLSVADVPLGKIRFTGVIGVVLWRGREYRLATYLGARAVKIQGGSVIIRQGNRTLAAQLLERRGRPLRAPTMGAMTRTIHESVSCRAHYRFQVGERTLFSFTSDRASFEYEYPERPHA